MANLLPIKALLYYSSRGATVYKNGPEIATYNVKSCIVAYLTIKDVRIHFGEILVAWLK